jgi:uncharacterized membrane protein SpoIIM required for sporulation
VGFLNHEEILEFVRLYRRASSDLATIRTRSDNEPLIVYLNNLVARAHGQLYKSPSKAFFTALRDLAVSAAQTYRRNRIYFWTSFGLLFGSAFFAFIVIKSDVGLLNLFIPDDENLRVWKSGAMEERSVDESISMSLFYAGNNPRVSIIAGSVGAGTMGLFSIAMLFQNGALLGGLAHEMASVGKLPYLLASLFPHGVPELSGIVFSAAGGLRFGWAILNPGVFSRGESLRRSAKDAVTMIVIGVMLCFIAAPIEGFFSFNPVIPSTLKTAFGSVTLVLWICFWKFFGRGEDLNSSKLE